MLGEKPRTQFLIAHVYNDLLQAEGEDVSVTSFVCSTDGEGDFARLFCWHSAFSPDQFKTKSDIDRAIYLPQSEFSFRLSTLCGYWGMDKNDVGYSDIELFIQHARRGNHWEVTR